MALDKKIVQRWLNTRVVLLGGSAGSFHLIFQAIKNFPANLEKTVIIVLHRKKNFFSEIEKLFSENTRISLVEISDKVEINKNTIYVAPANYHTLIEAGRYFSLDVSDPVWYSKPSIDVTFESAAEVFGADCTAVLFSGANQDGAQGLLKLRESGALTIAQSPQDAEMKEMPTAAIAKGAADYILTNDEIFELLMLTKSK